MAAELGASVKTTKRAALLHDIGKAVRHEVDGSHALISAQLARRRCGESEGSSTRSRRTTTRSSRRPSRLSCSSPPTRSRRPGLAHAARASRTTSGGLEALEEIATAKPGVAKAYALQAGREIRVIVEPTEVDDDGAVLLSHEIAREIEDQLEYPGQVKVIVIRESRAIEVAK